MGWNGVSKIKLLQYPGRWFGWLVVHVYLLCWVTFVAGGVFSLFFPFFPFFLFSGFKIGRATPFANMLGLVQESEMNCFQIHITPANFYARGCIGCYLCGVVHSSGIFMQM